jgi:transcriptional regulator with XRE-family HTH domain
MASVVPGPDLHHIGSYIRDRRERLGLLQVDVATRADMSAYHYREIEAGRDKASRPAYFRIAQALDIPADEMAELINGSAA